MKKLVVKVIIEEQDDSGLMHWSIESSDGQIEPLSGDTIACGHAQLHLGAVRMIEEQLEILAAQVFIPS
jgi:hypothetical protein